VHDGHAPDDQAATEGVPRGAATEAVTHLQAATLAARARRGRGRAVDEREEGRGRVQRIPVG
jgi:hypothetical protein